MIALQVESVELDDGVAEALCGQAERLLDACDLGEAELSLVLCSDAHMAELNHTWRGKEGTTDVLSFPQDDDMPAIEGIAPLLGDVVISVDRAREQGAEHGHDLATELDVLLVHGLCHLRGYVHDDDASRREMSAEETRLLAIVGRSAGLVERSGRRSG